MEPHLSGIYYLLYATPGWAPFAVLLPMTVVMGWWGTEREQGLSANTCVSWILGDCVSLPILVGMAQALIQREGVHTMPWFTQTQWYQILCLCVWGLWFGISVKTAVRRSARWMDKWWHDAIIAPLLSFLALTLVPVLWYGSAWEFWGAVCCGGLWALGFIADAVRGSFNQTEHLITVRIPRYFQWLPLDRQRQLMLNLQRCPSAPAE